jgi:hypothetical protein
LEDKQSEKVIHSNRGKKSNNHNEKTIQVYFTQIFLSDLITEGGKNENYFKSYLFINETIEVNLKSEVILKKNVYESTMIMMLLNFFFSSMNSLHI